MEKAIFLDRDGVINNNKRPVNKAKDLKIEEDAKIALKKAYDMGYKLFVVTNQGGIEKGYLTEEELKLIHEHMEDVLREYCKFQEICYCPYFDTKSFMRKPSPGMLLYLIEKYSLNPINIWMVGDRDSDIEAGINAKCKTAKIGRINKDSNINGKDLLDIINKIIKYDEN